MRKVQVYIETTTNTFERLELFNDEQIQINMSVQNVQDIAKVFTEFTQSFTIPASPHNNAIFQHFYENAVDGTIDHQKRRNSRIEIDLIPFRTGKIQLEKSNLKKGRVESYTITFFGDMISLKDMFGEDKLEILDLSPYSHVYTGGIIKNRIQGLSQNDVEWPLISSERLWAYGGGGAQDISQHSHHIHFDELFPAIKVKTLFQAIELYYGIEFDSLFFDTTSNKLFENLYLWLKNSETFEFLTEPKKVDLSSVSPYANAIEPASTFVDLTNNTFRMKTNTTNQLIGGLFFEITHELRYELSAISDSAATYYLVVRKNGNFFAEFTGLGNTTGNYVDIEKLPVGNINENDLYTFEFYSDRAVTMSFIFYYNIDGYNILGQQIRTGYSIYSTSATVSGKINLNKNVPDIKVADFVSGIFKQFNLTCTPITQKKFKVERLETWYALGRIIDVTKHIDVDSIDIERVKLYKKILFKYQKSDTLFNVNFSNLNKREYGNLEQFFNYDGGEYTIEVPFENMLHNRLSGNLQVGYSLDKDLQPIVPKPTLLYYNDRLACDFYFNDGSSTSQITFYKAFGQDVNYQSSDYTLNFGMDYSSLYETVIQNDIYNVYYRNYLQNLYNPKQRLTYVKGLFPTAILTSLQLNDRLIIRDKRYIINEIKTNLNTGEVDLVLLHDFRQLEALQPIITLNNGATTTDVLVSFPDGTLGATFNGLLTGITASPPSISVAGTIAITLPGVSNIDVMKLEDGDFLVYEDSVTVAADGNPYSVLSVTQIDYNLINGGSLSVPLTFEQVAIVG